MQVHKYLVYEHRLEPGPYAAFLSQALLLAVLLKLLSLDRSSDPLQGHILKLIKIIISTKEIVSK